LLGIFPAAVLIGMAFRFPIPFDGYVGGWAALREDPWALPLVPWWIVQGVAFYVAFGGFLVLIPLGAVGGLVGARLARSRPERAGRYVLGIALGIDLAAAGLLSVLELIIGPW
jgi:hypothetical protein